MQGLLRWTQQLSAHANNMPNNDVPITHSTAHTIAHCPIHYQPNQATHCKASVRTDHQYTAESPHSKGETKDSPPQPSVGRITERRPSHDAQLSGSVSCQRLVLIPQGILVLPCDQLLGVCNIYHLQ